MERYFFNTADYNNLVDALRDSFNHVNEMINAGSVFHRMVILAGENVSKVSIQGVLMQNFGMIRENGENRIPVIPLNVVFRTVRSYNVTQDFSDVVISYDLDSRELLKVEEKCGLGIDVNIEIKQYADIALWGGVWGVSCPGNEVNSFSLMTPNVVVRHALDQISRVINLGNRTVFNPADDEFVKTCVLALNHYLGIINSGAAFAYVIRTRHWSVGLANILKKYIEILNNGRYFRGGDRHRKRWRELVTGWQ